MSRVNFGGEYDWLKISEKHPNGVIMQQPDKHFGAIRVWIRENHVEYSDDTESRIGLCYTRKVLLDNYVVIV